MTKSWICTLLAAGLALATTPAGAQSISGPAEAVDGDSLTLTGTRIRLFGIDAVEARQTCNRDGTDWACGAEAGALMAQLVAGKQVRCERRDTDIYGRMVAVCHAGSMDLAQVMVEAGFAVGLPQFSADYLDAEARAKQAGFGIWSSAFEPPSDWRAAHPREDSVALAAAAEQPAPARVKPRRYTDQYGCAIKGNRNRRGEWIYHLPGAPYYDQTRPEELFCTEDEAIRAGYRPSKAR